MLPVQCRLHFLVENPFVRCVHVHENEPRGILRQDVNSVQLSEGVAQRRNVIGWHGLCRFDGCLVRPLRFDGRSAEGVISLRGGLSDMERLLVYRPCARWRSLLR